MKSKKRVNPIILNDGMTIGSLAAETDDDFLFDCFIHYPPVDTARRVEAHGSLLTGRTGAGKTAIIRYLKTVAQNTSQIEPSEMAMSYVSNSDALQFLQAIGADLDLLFQALWKHVLCIEFIRLRWSVTDATKSQSLFDRFFQAFSKDQRKQKAIKYLKDWEGQFWITMDENIKTLTERVEKKVEAELGGELHKWRTRGQYDKQLSNEKKTDLVRRVRDIISVEQLSELAGVIDLLSEQADHMDGEQNKFYIFVDQLDDRWVDTTVRFRLIRSLIETVKSFRRITNLKIIIAIRSDILERVLQETRDLSFQREKSEEYFIKIRWTRAQLKQMVDSRIVRLYRRQYTGQDVHFDDLFSFQVGRVDPFDYMVERTLMRPRDMIAFVNQCLKEAEGQWEITATHIRRAEIEYSRLRREALEQEWQSAFPTLRALLDFIAEQRKESVHVQELVSGEKLGQLALNLAAATKIDFDPIYSAATEYCDDPEQKALVFCKEVISILYRVGAIGLKIDAADRFRYSHLDEPVISSAVLPDDAKIRVHPMLHAALKVNVGRYAS